MSSVGASTHAKASRYCTHRHAFISVSTGMLLRSRPGPYTSERPEAIPGIAVGVAPTCAPS